MNITLRQMEIFLKIADEKNITSASSKVHISQAAASMALKELENQLGEKLFDRNKKRLVLNDRGRVFYSKAVEILSRVNEIENIFVSDDNLSGELLISASTTIGNYVLPEILGKFSEVYKTVDIKLEIGNTEQVVNSVKSFTSDIGFIEGPCFDNELIVNKWMDDELLIFTHTSNNEKDLLKHEWILREKGSGTREVFERAFTDYMPELKVKMELGNSEAIKTAVKSGLGTGCLSKRAVKSDIASDHVKSIESNLNLKRKFYSILHKDKYITALIAKFCELNNVCLR